MQLFDLAAVRPPHRRGSPADLVLRPQAHPGARGGQDPGQHGAQSLQPSAGPLGGAVDRALVIDQPAQAGHPPGPDRPPTPVTHRGRPDVRCAPGGSIRRTGPPPARRPRRPDPSVDIRGGITARPPSGRLPGHSRDTPGAAGCSGTHPRLLGKASPRLWCPRQLRRPPPTTDRGRWGQAGSGLRLDRRVMPAGGVDRRGGLGTNGPTWEWG